MKSNNFFPKGVKEFFSDATSKAVKQERIWRVKDSSLFVNFNIFLSYQSPIYSHDAAYSSPVRNLPGTYNLQHGIFSFNSVENLAAA